ncbi:hypothetical protein EPO34_03295 [Patescibacteria group bacterium]|nr:MAG: hypothetical protein EPO34_03295 [Patescibacteria group bacterium]
MKRLSLKLSAAASAASLALAPLATRAAITLDKGLADIESASGLTGGEGGLPALIGNLIKGVLGVLGIILVIYLVWAGFKWMTAAGDSKKVDEAKAMIQNAVIGIVIVVAAYAIASFVIKLLSTAVGG